MQHPSPFANCAVPASLATRFSSIRGFGVPWLPFIPRNELYISPITSGLLAEIYLFLALIQSLLGS